MPRFRPSGPFCVEIPAHKVGVGTKISHFDDKRWYIVVKNMWRVSEHGKLMFYFETDDRQLPLSFRAEDYVVVVADLDSVMSGAYPDPSTIRDHP